MNIKVLPLLGLLVLGLAGCLPEDEPNNDPSEAWYNGDHPTQWWYGDENLPGPNGSGVLTGTSASGTSSDVDCWPISMYSPDGEYSEVTELAGYIWLNPSCDVSVGLMGYVGLNDDGVEIWEWIEPLQPYACIGDEVICAREISLRVDVFYSEIAVVFEGRGDYGFFLTPFID